MPGAPAQKRSKHPKEEQSALPGGMEGPPKLVVLDLQRTLSAQWLAFQEPRSLLGTAFHVAWGQASVGREELCFQVNMRSAWKRNQPRRRDAGSSKRRLGIREESGENIQRKGEAVRDSSQFWVPEGTSERRGKLGVRHGSELRVCQGRATWILAQNDKARS